MKNTMIKITITAGLFFSMLVNSSYAGVGKKPANSTNIITKRVHNNKTIDDSSVSSPSYQDNLQIQQPNELSKNLDLSVDLVNTSNKVVALFDVDFVDDSEYIPNQNDLLLKVIKQDKKTGLTKTIISEFNCNGQINNGILACEIHDVDPIHLSTEEYTLGVYPQGNLIAKINQVSLNIIPSGERANTKMAYTGLCVTPSNAIYDKENSECKAYNLGGVIFKVNLENTSDESAIAAIANNDLSLDALTQKKEAMDLSDSPINNSQAQVELTAPTLLSAFNIDLIGQSEYIAQKNDLYLEIVETNKKTKKQETVAKDFCNGTYNNGHVSCSTLTLSSFDDQKNYYSLNIYSKGSLTVKIKEITAAISTTKSPTAVTMEEYWAPDECLVEFFPKTKSNFSLLNDSRINSETCSSYTTGLVYTIKN